MNNHVLSSGNAIVLICSKYHPLLYAHSFQLAFCIVDVQCFHAFTYIISIYKKTTRTQQFNAQLFWVLSRAYCYCSLYSECSSWINISRHFRVTLAELIICVGFFLCVCVWCSEEAERVSSLQYQALSLDMGHAPAP